MVGPQAAELVGALRKAGWAATSVAVDQVAADATVIDLRWAGVALPVEDALWGVVQLARRLPRGRLWVVTRGGGPHPEHPDAVGLASGIASLKFEAPHLVPSVVDIGVEAAVSDIVPGLAVDEGQVAVRDGVLWVRRLERVRLKAAAPRFSGRWWITGGLGRTRASGGRLAPRSRRG